MASVSASHLILFIASVLVAASVAGTITNTVGRLSEGVSEQGDALSQDVRTDVEVISDSGAQIYNRTGDENVTLLVKNTGSRILPANGDQLTVLLDGAFQSDIEVTVVDGENPDSWRPGDVVRVEFATPDLASGDHRVKVSINGDEEVFRFNV
ncbi:flagellar protein G [Halapricum desulfuricans]|uniref:Archaellum protein G, flagellin of FlaG/FlaF family n=1 Tax=Halapricum desulfuricans TaxID=2841257 RepID=A0A897NKT8_9EURY|nr:flagellar protein G [Halapricum desulfuricans]QSG10049.1 Archaellum protein G, flagellin of FlaG/FlaF family [Halapricum desulfuricans]QSG10866.1 Archaellum protein G, flagellin of FlaG/FlaF family [Halapricum desulfuricans]